MPVVALARDECPRCAVRLGKTSRLFRSDLPPRVVAGLARRGGRDDPRPPAGEI